MKTLSWKDIEKHGYMPLEVYDRFPSVKGITPVVHEVTLVRAPFKGVTLFVPCIEREGTILHAYNGCDSFVSARRFAQQWATQADGALNLELQAKIVSTESLLDPMRNIVRRLIRKYNPSYTG